MILRNRLFIFPALTLLLFVAAAAPSAEGLKVFFHKKHIDEGVDCSDCHELDAQNDSYSLVADICEGCHDQVYTEWKLSTPARKLESDFSHSKHHKKMKCTDCHGSTASDSHEAGSPVMDFEGCSDCHREKDSNIPESQCARCHGEDLKNRAPDDHAHAWTRRHGAESGWRVFDEHGRDCEQCHARHQCIECHRTQKPADHTSLWRVRTHGTSADWDRERCRKCHETGTCVRCHRTTEPLNHRGAWKYTHGLAAQSRSSRYCNVCHSTSTCRACHKGKTK